MARICIADEDRHIRELFFLEISELGHEVIPTTPCHKLIKKIRESQPDLIILETMPLDCDGLEILREIRECFCNLPVIIWNSYDSCEYKQEAAAPTYFVTKSSDLSELKEKIQLALVWGEEQKFSVMRLNSRLRMIYSENTGG